MNLLNELRMLFRKIVDGVRQLLLGVQENSGRSVSQRVPPYIIDRNRSDVDQPQPARQPPAATTVLAALTGEAAQPPRADSAHGDEQPTAVEPREPLPGNWQDYRDRAKALREQGRPDEAEAMLREALERFPHESGAYHDLARLAERRSDWAAAEQWWRRCLAASPNQWRMQIWWAHTGLAVALRHQGRNAEAEALLVEAQDRLPAAAGVFEEHARLAETTKDWDQAQVRWAACRERFPDRWAGYRGDATALREQGRADEAEALLLQAIERFPRETGAFQDLARLAERRGDWAAMERWCRSGLAINPSTWQSHTGLAVALRRQGRIGEAEAHLVAAQDRLPNEPAVFEEHASLAEAAQDWDQAQQRWAAIRQRFPNRSAGYRGGARVLREQGLLDEAAALLMQTTERFPRETGACQDLARLAGSRGDWPGAERWWRRCLTISPNAAWALAGLAATRRQQKKLAEAKALLDE
jgi:tetratricopeptide (TPR) repeat protein